MYADADELRSRIGASVFEEIYPDGTDAVTDLTGAEAEINGCVGRRYAIPVMAAASLALLKDWTLTLAEERAYARAAGAEYSEKVSSRVAQVRKYLEEIRSGLFLLPDAAEMYRRVPTRPLPAPPWIRQPKRPPLILPIPCRRST
ncbi:MAG: DUF1320 family protein [Clostridia bacterium]|nr:DUF1320 family protein [Clostridia bacterium]